MYPACILTGHIKIHAGYMHDTCAIHGIRILITNPPKLDNKPHVTRCPPVYRPYLYGHFALLG